MGAAVAGGVLFFASNLFLIGADYNEFASTVTTRTFAAHAVLFWAAAVVFLLALVGLYAHQSVQAGAIGFAGFVVAFAGTALALATAWSETFVLAVLADEAPEMVDDPPSRVAASLWVSLPVFLVGWLLFAVASLSAGVLPRAPLFALLVAIVLFVPAFAVPGLGAVFGGALAWLGYATYASLGGRDMTT